MKLFLIIFFFNLIAVSEESLVQVPEACVEKKSSPCLIKSKVNTVLNWQGILFNLRKDSLVQLTTNSEIHRVDVLTGFVKLNSLRPYKIFGYDVKSDSDQYVSAFQDFVEILDLKNFDLKTLTVESSGAENIYVLQKSNFLNRRELVQQLSHFYSDPGLLKEKLTQLTESYQNKLRSVSLQQSEFLKKKQDREIASIEFAEKQRMAEEKQQKIDRKRSRELFFMRTFKR